jgi:hypothetical protein
MSRTSAARWRPDRPAPPRGLARAALAFIVAASPGLTGCYRHVVRAEGPGADRYDVHEPNVEPDQPLLDEAFRGQDRTRPPRK